jgi:hypothetical protein
LQFEVTPENKGNATYNLTFYIRRNSLPGFLAGQYDANYTIVNNVTGPFVIPTPLPGTYYMLTNNTNPDQVSLLINVNYNTGCSILNQTNPNCPTVNVTSPAAQFTAALTGTQYFQFNSSQLLFGVGTAAATNAPPIYLASYQFANESGWPSQYSYDAASNTNGAVNFFNFEAEPLPPQPSGYVFRFGAANPNVTRIWRIAVIANSSLTYYYWTGYCAYNCTPPGKTTAEGTCNAANGTCTCSSTKVESPLFCSRSGLSVGWIIVIIIIVIIVVACAIGIPLALYLRQRRSKNYERV